MWEIPGGFWAEGSADFSARHALDLGIPQHSLWKIESLFTDYTNEFNIVPDLEHISTNPNLMLDIYFLGDMFFEYLYINHGGYEKIREFFNAGMDYTVFNATYEEIDIGYINYLKYLYTLLDTHEPQLIVNNGITIERGKSAIIETVNLNASDLEVQDDKLFFEISTNTINGQIEKISNPGVQITKFTEQDLKSKEIQYVNIDTTAASDYFIFTLTDETFFIDNKRFNITLTAPTAISDITGDDENNFMIYPNPVTEHSLISFHVSAGGNVNLSILDMTGRNICTLFNKNLESGTHSVLIGNRINTNGVYLCRLVTSKGVSTLKLIVNKKF